MRRGRSGPAARIMAGFWPGTEYSRIPFDSTDPKDEAVSMTGPASERDLPGINDRSQRKELYRKDRKYAPVLSVRILIRSGKENGSGVYIRD